jgi:hypothetical protein
MLVLLGVVAFIVPYKLLLMFVNKTIKMKALFS